MNSINLQVDHPWVFLFLIPAVLLALWPYFKIKKHRRRTRNRVVSMVLHMIILFLITAVFANFKFRVEDVLLEKDTILLVDVSDSSHVSKEKIDNYMESILKDYNNPNEVGIVTFGNDSEYVARLSSNASSVYGKYKDYDVEHKTDATNIQAALLHCQEILGKDGGRIIILTDGLQTDGDAILTANKLAKQKIQIDAVFFGNEPLEKEVQINNLEVELPVALNTETNINVYLESASTALATVTLYDGEEEIGKQENVFIHSGETILTFVHQFVTEGDHFLYVTVETSEEKDDTYKENNKYYSLLNISLDTKILLVEGMLNEGDNLYTLLSEEYEIERVRANAVPNDGTLLSEYSEIILMNVSTTTLPKGFDVTLEEYIKRGGNVLTTGGENTYYWGEMENTRFNEFLPINVIKEEQSPIAVLLVIDKSSSMNQNLNGSYATKMEIAKQAAVESVKSLRDCDYVGVVAFDEKAELVVPMTPVTLKTEIINKINTIQSGMGTHYVPALQEANKELVGFYGTETKHIIFLSDGEPQDNGYGQYVSALMAKNITTTTIGIGTANNYAALDDMARIGGGNSYGVTSSFDLARIMVEEIENLKTEYTNDKEPLVPKIRRYTSVVSGITGLPQIDGYIGTTLKDGAVEVVQAKSDPLYAQWEYGEGTVASFMSDLKGKWTSKFFTDERGKTFIKNIVKTLLADASIKGEFDISFERQNYTNKIVVEIPPTENVKMEATIIYPDDKKEIITLTLTSKNTYSGIIPNYGKEGVYKVNIVRTIGNKESIESSFTSFSYSTEYDAFYNNEENFEFVQKLVKSGKGSIYTFDDDVFAHEIIYDDIHINPQLGMLIAALALFLLDIAVRKFNFKWPHEIWGKKKKEEVEA